MNESRINYILDGLDDSDYETSDEKNGEEFRKILTLVPDDKTFKKSQESGAYVVNVRDNSSIVMLSTNESAEPLCNVRRWSKSYMK